MRYRKLSEDYLEKLDCEEKIIKHTHERKVSFEETTHVRIFDQRDHVVDYDEEYSEELERDP